MQFNAYSNAHVMTHAGHAINKTLYNELIANWAATDNASGLAKRLDENQKFGDGRTNYLGWVITIGKSFLYYRSIFTTTTFIPKSRRYTMPTLLNFLYITARPSQILLFELPLPIHSRASLH